MKKKSVVLILLVQIILSCANNTNNVVQTVAPNNILIQVEDKIEKITGKKINVSGFEDFNPELLKRILYVVNEL